MARENNFVFRVSEEERIVINPLARRLRRTQSDAVRYVVLEVARALESGAPTHIRVPQMVQPVQQKVQREHAE